jgi:hypothetical protein
MIKFGPKPLLPIMAMISACQSPEAQSIALIEGKQHPSPQVRDVSEPQPGLICGEVRWKNLTGGYSSWWSFHIKDGDLEIVENYTEIWDPNFGKETAFSRTHRLCKMETSGPI